MSSAAAIDGGSADPPRQLTEQGRERKQQLVDAAAALFAERGYGATRISDICARAGVAKGLFYWYFPTKLDLFSELVRTMRHRLRKAQGDAMDPSADPLTRIRRHARLRKKVVGTAVRPRLVVNRSSRHVFVQLVDDDTSTTLASASTMEADLRAMEGDKTAKAKRVGELLAERAKAAGVDAVVFDRGGNRYAGRVAAIADGAREGGLSL